ncbi:M20/M25/M40 family metallo-hydrolase [Actinomadura sp. HBU206391]|uniref:M20/M25/M40 family metallo-hydrolase n=1 Tax=Actinomadura sp. HBU206391 TaxID=2731692 RepID=UPI00164FD9C3|nr:M20/M25/M40 family metallo-hydrolase [Actinomadura sp. HBU206391]MBC6461397.1 M20/M25/M40 family metallo-hydrolase [Actinomadura sp. HBU206391]
MTLTDDTAVDLLSQLLTIHSPSGHEHRLAGFLEGALRELGFSAHLDEVGNVIGDIGTGAGPTIMFLSHLDTVDRPMPATRDGERLRGRGAVDAKAPLAAMICAAARRAEFAGTVRVVGAVEEERLSRGGHHIARTQPQPDALVIGEPSGWSGVVLGYRGKVDLEYRVQRPSTHSTNPMRKASEVAVDFWRDLLAALGPELDHAAFGLPAATLRAIRADVLEAWLDVDCRIPPDFDVPAFVAALRAAAGTGELNVVRHTPAVRVSRADPVVRALSAAIRRQGGTPRPLLKTGTSDMNTVSGRWRTPMAAYGPGDSSLDHGDDESIDIAEYLRGVEVLATALDELAAGPAPEPPAETERT